MNEPLPSAKGRPSTTLLLGGRLGVPGVAWAQVISSGLVLTINYAVLLATMQMRLFEIVRRNYRVIVVSAGMSAPVSAFADSSPTWPAQPIWLRLALLIAVGMISYFGILIGLWTLLGKPAGPEIDLRDLSRAATASVRSLVRRIRPLQNP